MLAAVVHVGGSKAARDVLARARTFAGEPDALADGVDGAVAVWVSAARLSVHCGWAVEGDLEDTESETLSGRAIHDRLEDAAGDFALVASTGNGLVVGSGPGGGHRPIFMTSTEDWVAGATSLRILLALLDSRPQLDLDYLASCTQAEYGLDPTATPYLNIQRLPLGESWRLRTGRPPERRSTVRPGPSDEYRASEPELAGLLRDAITAAVERSTRSARKIGVMLSGGLDSSTTLLTLENLRLAGRVAAPFEAYSWEFDTPDPSDDRPYRRAVENKIGRPSWPIDPKDAGPFVRRAMVLDAAPCFDVPCALWLATDRAAHAHGVDRILTGLGGDNVLDGHPWLFSELARRGRVFTALRKAVALRGPNETSPYWNLRQYVLRPLVSAITPNRIRAIRRGRARRRRFDWMGPRFESWLGRHSAKSPPIPMSLDWSAKERYAALARMPFLSLITLVRSQHEEVTRCRRSEPLFDDGLLRTVARFPPLALLAGNSLRGLLRESMADRLPSAVKTRPWKAYMEPAVARMVAAAGGFTALQDLAHTSRLADLGLVEPKPFRAHFDRLASRPLDALWWTVWPALAVEAFLRQYDEGWTD